MNNIKYMSIILVCNGFSENIAKAIWRTIDLDSLYYIVSNPFIEFYL